MCFCGLEEKVLWQQCIFGKLCDCLKHRYHSDTFEENYLLNMYLLFLSIYDHSAINKTLSSHYWARWRVDALLLQLEKWSALTAQGKALTSRAADACDGWGVRGSPWEFRGLVRGRCIADHSVQFDIVTPLTQEKRFFQTKWKWGPRFSKPWTQNSLTQRRGN